MCLVFSIFPLEYPVKRMIAGGSFGVLVWETSLTICEMLTEIQIMIAMNTLFISDRDDVNDDRDFEMHHTDARSETDDDSEVEFTALHAAIKARRLENIQILLEHGAVMYIRTAHG
ncbi:hypothetical protein N7481_010433 [Penicillium waksmanii]|uniref:uncharacterized protein n=1 Tax=Penicillium waksmanii TaxID=69791 RepID=UPI00254712D4|nr:uncharacterized protein N7481_010433 [Penicillium waksmanii]KAJ5973223.1 hypothetical protein N7481_010433 [Penicillium waksmanii]